MNGDTAQELVTSIQVAHRAKYSESGPREIWLPTDVFTAFLSWCREAFHMEALRDPDAPNVEEGFRYGPSRIVHEPRAPIEGTVIN